MAFQHTQKVMFKHCDPAGIVFYPRYFEMMNDCVEMFFDLALGCPFENLHQCGGVPTAAIQTRFAAPSRHGDLLSLSLVVTKVGGSSLRYSLMGHCDGELRFETEATLVQVDADGKSFPWNDQMRAELTTFMEGQT